MLQIPNHCKTTYKTPRQIKEQILKDPDMFPIYQQWINEHDFKPRQLLKALSQYGCKIGEAFKPYLTDILLEHRIWKQNGSKQCICGFRTDSGAILAQHQRQCGKHQKLLKQIEKEIFNTTKMQELFNEQELLPIDVSRLIVDLYKLPDSYKMYFFNYVYRKARELSEKGIIKWSKDAEHVRRAYHERSKKTIQQKYGVDNISQLEEVKEKKKQTCLKHFGVEYSMQHPNVLAKSKNTVKQKYGVENVSQLNEVKEKKKQTFLTHYGIDNIFRDTEYIKNCVLSKYGVTNPTQHPIIKIKAITKTLLQNKQFYIGRYEEILFVQLEKLFQQYYTDFNIEWNKILFTDINHGLVFIPDFVVTIIDTNQRLIVEFQEHKSHLHILSNQLKDLIRFHLLYNIKRLPVFTIWDTSVNEDLNILENWCQGKIEYNQYWQTHLLKPYKENIIQTAQFKIKELGTVHLKEIRLPDSLDDIDKILEQTLNGDTNDSTIHPI